MITAKAFTRKSIACLIAVAGVLASSVAWSSPSHDKLTKSIRRELIEQSGALYFSRPREGAREPDQTTAEEFVRTLEGGQHVYLPIGHMASPELAKALAERAQQGAFSPANPLTIVGMSNTVSPKIFPRDGSVRVLSPFAGGAYRAVIARGHGDFVPIDYSLIPQAYRNGAIPIDIAVHMISEPANGFTTLGSSLGEGLAAMQAATIRVAEINPNVPPTHGASRVHMSHFNAVFHGSEKLKVLRPEKATEDDRAIAHHIAELIKDGEWFQFGIGAIPDEVARTLAKTGRKYRIWSQLLSDGIVDMVNAGAVEGPVVYTFAMGSQKVLDALHGNKRYFALPVDVVNNGQLLWRMPGLMATNGALALGLNGLPNAFMRGPTVYSGIGGGNDFPAGARHSPGGRAVFGLPATYRDQDGPHSRIVPEIHGGVTTPGQNVTHVVTQRGVASLLDTESNRAAALIGIADPAFQPWLQSEFDKQMAARVASEAADYEKFLSEKGKVP